MTEKRFVNIGVEWIDGFIQDHEDDKDLFNVGAVCNLLNELNNENKQLKSINQDHKDHLADFYADYDRLEKENEQLKIVSNENSILWNEIHILMEQGVELSDAFKKYLDDISTDYDKFWRRKIKQAKMNKVIE